MKTAVLLIILTYEIKQKLRNSSSWRDFAQGKENMKTENKEQWQELEVCMYVCMKYVCMYVGTDKSFA